MGKSFLNTPHKRAHKLSQTAELTKTSGCLHQPKTECERRGPTCFISLQHKRKSTTFPKLILSIPGEPYLNNTKVLCAQYRRDVLLLMFHSRRPLQTIEDLLVFIWTSGPLQFVDASPALQPFSYYQYRVQAFNSKGSVLSHWALAQTRQAQPQDMAAPTITPTGESHGSLEKLLLRG